MSLTLNQQRVGFSGGGATGGGTITGSGTVNYLAKFTPSGTSIGDSQIFDDGTSIGVFTTTLTGDFNVIKGSTAFAAYFGSASTKIKFSTDATNAYIGTSTNQQLNIQVNGSTAMLINTSFNVGVGGAPIAATRFAAISSTNDNTSYSFRGTNLAGTNQLYLRGDGASRFDGQVGIGVDNTTYPLHIQGGGGNSAWFVVEATNSGFESLINARSDSSNMYMRNFGSTYAQNALFPELGPNKNVFQGSGSGGVWYSCTGGASHNWTIGTGGGTNIFATIKSSGNFINYLNGNMSVTPVTQELSGESHSVNGVGPGTIQTLDLSVVGNYVITSRIVYTKLSGAGLGAVGDGAAFIITQSFKNVGGTITATGAAQATYAGTPVGLESVVYTISGTNILVQFTGLLNDLFQVGSSSTVTLQA